jgi:UDP-N-acetylglucosamine--N-acetylmuramyl-(pentapeptide) pyrophosphoryl-undecaprenol N-acetylglucosamine transferase
MSDKNKKIIICAGGTGGHVFPAKKLSEILLKQAVEISWIGSSRGTRRTNMQRFRYKISSVSFNRL